MNEMMKLKLSPDLQELVLNHTLPDPVSVIVQLKGEDEKNSRLTPADQQMVEMLGGSVLDDLWLIKGFSALLPAKALESLVLSPRVTVVHLNSDVAGVD